MFVRPNIAEWLGVRKAYPTGDALPRSTVLRAAILSGLTVGGGHSQHKCPAPIGGLKLLFVAASFINHGTHAQADTPDSGGAGDRSVTGGGVTVIAPCRTRRWV